MSNTRDILGEQATLDGLIAHTITDFEEDEVKTLATNALRNNTGLQTLKLPSLTKLSGNALFDCSNLTTVDIGKKCEIGKAFSGCYKLNSLILRNADEICILNADAFEQSGIGFCLGGIFVPDNLLSTYKSATNWSAYADNIYPLSEYPKSDFSSISDSWSTIITNCNAGTIDSYNVGGTKILDVNNEPVVMQIVAKNTDKLANNTGTAALTWLCKNLYTKKRMNSSNTNSGGWEATEMRSWLRETILNYFPSEVQNGIKEVIKPWYDYNNGSGITRTSNETIWIPSSYEMYSNIENGYVVETGNDNVRYNFFNNKNKIIIRGAGISTYFLRSSTTDSAYSFYMVNGLGNRSSANATSTTTGVLFGFCT